MQNSEAPIACLLYLINILWILIPLKHNSAAVVVVTCKLWTRISILQIRGVLKNYNLEEELREWSHVYLFVYYMFHVKFSAISVCFLIASNSLEGLACSLLAHKFTEQIKSWLKSPNHLLIILKLSVFSLLGFCMFSRQRMRTGKFLW